MKPTRRILNDETTRVMGLSRFASSAQCVAEEVLHTDASTCSVSSLLKYEETQRSALVRLAPATQSPQCTAHTTSTTPDRAARRRGACTARTRVFKQDLKRGGTC
jgi:hypothetical protein